ncbi:MAG: hypothetical protein NT107_15460 [Planctomycetota bacterium]|nr:hypothetical protein [Planctomycetota bacterium]
MLAVLVAVLVALLVALLVVLLGQINPDIERLSIDLAKHLATNQPARCQRLAAHV